MLLADHTGREARDIVRPAIVSLKNMMAAHNGIGRLYNLSNIESALGLLRGRRSSFFQCRRKAKARANRG